MSEISILSYENDFTKIRDIINLDNIHGVNNIYNNRDYLFLNYINETKLFVYRNSEKMWVYPFSQQVIDSKFIKDSTKFFYDIESPYGYYGPFSNTKDSGFILSANSKFNSWCVENNIIAEFVRFNPLFQNQDLRFGIDITFNRKTLGFNLENLPNIEKIFDSKMMNQVNNYKKYNVSIEVSSSYDLYNQFVNLYKKKMVFLKAQEFYLFSNSSFNNLFEFIKNNGIFVTACIQKKLIGGMIILFDNKNAYYHLSAINPENKISGITNAMLYYTIKYFFNKKFNIFFLGGGNSNSLNDKLYRFKKKMANEEYDFYIGKKIYNKEKYNEIISNWSKMYPYLNNSYKEFLLKYKYKS